jgi:hypothetical protein
MADRKTEKASGFLQLHNKPGLSIRQSNLPAAGKAGRHDRFRRVALPAEAVTLKARVLSRI